MTDNTTGQDDEKNERTNANMQAAYPSPGDTISLHDAAVALTPKSTKASKAPKKVNDIRLLQALKSAAVRSGFHCTAVTTAWIEIPASHWLQVSSEKFRSIRRVAKDKSRTGTYEVTLVDFSDQYAAISVNQSEKSGRVENWTKSAISRALLQSRQKYEVVIPLASWKEYRSGHGATTEAPKAPLGRAVFGGWKLLNAWLAAYLVANNIKTRDEGGGIKGIATEVYAMAVKEEPPKTLPDFKSFQKEVSVVFDRIDRLRET